MPIDARFVRPAAQIREVRTVRRSVRDRRVETHSSRYHRQAVHVRRRAVQTSARHPGGARCPSRSSADTPSWRSSRRPSSPSPSRSGRTWSRRRSRLRRRQPHAAIEQSGPALRGDAGRTRRRQQRGPLPCPGSAGGYRRQRGGGQDERRVRDDPDRRRRRGHARPVPHHRGLDVPPERSDDAGQLHQAQHAPGRPVPERRVHGDERAGPARSAPDQRHGGVPC